MDCGSYPPRNSTCLTKMRNCHLDGTWWAPANLIGDDRNTGIFIANHIGQFKWLVSKRSWHHHGDVKISLKIVVPRKIQWYYLFVEKKRRTIKSHCQWVGLFFFTEPEQVFYWSAIPNGSLRKVVADQSFEQLSFRWSSGDNEFWCPQK